MAKIGNWGSIIKFQTSDRRILTFKEMSKTYPIRTNVHNLLGRKPKVEFVGPDLEKVTFTIELDAMYCRKPLKVERKLQDAAQHGIVAPLIVGGKCILHHGIITELSSHYDIIIKHGGIYSMKLDVTMMEYN